MLQRINIVSRRVTPLETKEAIEAPPSLYHTKDEDDERDNLSVVTPEQGILQEKYLHQSRYRHKERGHLDQDLDVSLRPHHHAKT